MAQQKCVEKVIPIKISWEGGEKENERTHARFYGGAEIDAELQAVMEELEIVAQMIEKAISTNAITALDQDEYAKSYESLTERYTALQKRYTALTKQRADKEYKADILSGFLFEIGELELLDTEWSDSRFHAVVERITVHNDGRLVFTFRNGSEETVMM